MQARLRALARLQTACAPTERAMLEQAIADLDRRIAAARLSLLVKSRRSHASPRGGPPGCSVPTAGAKLSCTTVGSTPTITIHVPGPLRAYCAGAGQLSISARTVREVLDDLERSQSALYCNICDETGAVRRHLNVFVNSDNVRDLDGMDTALTSGDVVTFLPAVSGG